MAYPLTPGMQTADFRREVIDHHFPALPAELKDDYAAIGAFLTRPADVLAALRPLENRLRDLALAKATARAAGGPAPAQQQGLYATRENTRKILTTALAETETLAGFNQAKAGVLLHDNAVFGLGDGPALDLTTAGRTAGGRADPAVPRVDLPAGVPKIIGAIHPTDFMILLKHGYAFKDVGAESGHGEFTHRLQWYAVIEARRAGTLAVVNEPIDLYKRMWLSSTKGTANLAPGRALYMWMALFDCLGSDAEAGSAQFKTMAWSPDTFNNPEKMNATLTRQVYGTTNVFNPADASNLYVLRRLLGARQAKRSGTYDGTNAYHEKKMVDDPRQRTHKTVVASRNATGSTALADLKNVVVWLDNL